MPVAPQIPANCKGVSEVGGQHPIRRPPINEPSVNGIGSIRHPNRAEMSAIFVSGIRITLKFKPPRTHTF